VRPYPGGVRHDYKDSGTAPRAFGLRAIDPRAIMSRGLNRRGLSWFAAGLILPLVGVSLLLVSETNESMVPAAEATVAAAGLPLLAPLRPTETVLLPSSGERIRLELPPPAAHGMTAEAPPRPEERARMALLAQGESLTLTVKSGDSLDSMFRRNNLSVADLGEMIRLPAAADDLARIRPGNRFEIIHDGARVLSLSREISDSQELWIKRDGEGYVAEFIDLETETRTAGAHGVISSSLWNAGIEAGLDDDVIQTIDNIFEWDIDFMLEVRTGDSFTVIYEEVWRDGVKLRNGAIIAAEYVNRGKSYRAARYIDTTGQSDYFTPDGMNVQRRFLRNPIEFSRVSSSFNPNRRHPILNTIRAHRGVDLAAPTGTPIRAAGDGRIVALGAYGSFGNRVEIQHGGGITTLYAHLNAFGKFRNGDRVSQGEVIGYVGMTGGATGPHLHYEYRLNGVHQNPQTVDLPEADPIAQEYRDDFRASTASLWRQLDLYQGTLLASNAD